MVNWTWHLFGNVLVCVREDVDVFDLFVDALLEIVVAIFVDFAVLHLLIENASVRDQSMVIKVLPLYWSTIKKLRKVKNRS